MKLGWATACFLDTCKLKAKLWKAFWHRHHCSNTKLDKEIHVRFSVEVLVFDTNWNFSCSLTCFQLHNRMRSWIFSLRMFHVSLAIPGMTRFCHCNLQCSLTATMNWLETFLECNEIYLPSVIHRHPKVQLESHCVITWSKFHPHAFHCPSF